MGKRARSGGQFGEGEKIYGCATVDREVKRNVTYSTFYSRQVVA